MTNPNPPNQFEPGQSGNPAGRPPKGYSLTEILRQKVSELDPETKKEYRELMVNKLLKIAIRKGDLTAIKLAWQYLDGMPLQKTDITSGGKPLNQLSGETLAKIDEAYAKQTDTVPEPNTA